MRFPTVAAIVALAVPSAAAVLQLQNLAAMSNIEFTQMLVAAGCYSPLNWIIKDFKQWTPAGGKAGSPSISFRFVDSENPTPIDTLCRLNSTSKSLTAGAGTGVAARYHCDNRLVSFIWQKNVLNMVERVMCPDRFGYVPAFRPCLLLGGRRR